jgi:hypothetical protein
MPEVSPGEKGNLFFEGHLGNQGLDFLFIHDHVLFLNKDMDGLVASGSLPD